MQEIIFKEYVYKRQTLEDLGDKYNKSPRWIQQQIFEYEPNAKEHKPRNVSLVCDARFKVKFFRLNNYFCL